MPGLRHRRSERALAHERRARAVITDLLDSLGATTSYAEREPRRREKVPWRALYGWELAAVPARGAVLDADGRPSQFELVKKFSHEPGEIVRSAPERSGGQVRRYMVRPDHSLRAI